MAASGTVHKREPADPASSTSTGNTQSKVLPSSTGSSRHSPVTPLAPLEYLQNQRRGSITDPSLHAGPPSHTHLNASAASSNISPSFRHSDSGSGSGPYASSSSQDPQARNLIAHPRPDSPYKFGDASAQPDGAHAHIRRYLRSPSSDAGSQRTPGNGPLGADGTRSTPGPTEHGGESSRAQGTDRMDVDPQGSEQHQRHDAGGPQRPTPVRESGDIDPRTRRRSNAAGTKRKVSSDQEAYSTGPEGIDPQLVGPGVSSGINVDAEGPAPKRRGSAIDTQRIAQLSLYDRRNSVDARIGGHSWWGSERRDSSTSSTFASTPGAYTPSSATPGDSPHGRPPGGIATFAWPANPHPDQAAGPSMQNEPNVNMAGPPHSYDPLAIMAPVAFAPDRRMSAPAMSPESLQTPPSTGPTRVLRSRSRPPSRVRGVDQSSINNAGPSSSAASGGSVQLDDAQPTTPKDSTPYSRSPELRVSHKLAERKRRKEMKDLFDELREQLPADRGMKASKWEILSKAIDFIMTLKQSHQDMSREIDMLRHELDGARQGIPPPFAGGPVVYGHGPPVGVAPYPPPGPAGPPPPHQPPMPHQQHPQVQPPTSRPGSSQNMYPPSAPPGVPQQNANGNGPGAPRTDTPS
ncbi:hypothetical protein B0H21DRAFT_758298 [Amylocystis lapponica]|nr:hypothetical protein B0H21DRAFT_758298 [Amylocystis lapponica]